MFDNNDRYTAAAHWLVGFRVAVKVCDNPNDLDFLLENANSDWEDFIENHDTAMSILNGDFVNVIHRDHLVGFVNSVKRSVGLSWGAEV